MGRHQTKQHPLYGDEVRAAMFSFGVCLKSEYLNWSFCIRIVSCCWGNSVIGWQNYKIKSQGQVVNRRWIVLKLNLVKDGVQFSAFSSAGFFGRCLWRVWAWCCQHCRSNFALKPGWSVGWYQSLVEFCVSQVKLCCLANHIYQFLRLLLAELGFE